MIAETERLLSLLERQEDELGSATMGRAISATLRVSPNGTGADGLSWRTAYQEIQDALDAASTDDEDCTLILITPHGAGYYDINRTGDPTWAANVILQGTHRNWAKVMNDHDGATSILKLTGRSSVYNINFNLGTGNNGLIQTRGGARTRHCQFIGEDLTVPATALWYDTNAGKHFKAFDLDFLGKDSTKMTAIKVDDLCCSEIETIRIHDCLKGIHILGANAYHNIFSFCDIGDCAIGIDIDAGNENTFHEMILHNTLNVDDEVHDSIWTNIHGAFPMEIDPDDMTGITLTADNVANVFGPDTELRAAALATKPFRVIASYVEPQIAQWYQLRLSADSGVTFFDRIMISTSRAAGSLAPSGTEFIFNTGARISGSIKAESGGSDTMKVWLKIQEI